MNELYKSFLAVSSNWDDETYYAWYSENAKKELGSKYEDNLERCRLVVKLAVEKLEDPNASTTLLEALAEAPTPDVAQAALRLYTKLEKELEEDTER